MALKLSKEFFANLFNSNEEVIESSDSFDNDESKILTQIKYNFTAIAEDGKPNIDTLMALSINDARKKLKQRGLLPIMIKKDKTLFQRVVGEKVRSINLKSVSLFCSQLHSIISSGVNILTGIHIMSKLSKDKRIKNVVSVINNEIQKGKSISMAMDPAKTGLPPLLINMISVGEVSGNLDEVLKNMSIYYEKESQVKGKVRGAMIYPIILSLLGAGMLVFFMTFVLPEIMDVILESGQELPLVTKIVLGSVDIIKAYGLNALLSLVSLIVVLKVAVPKEKFKRGVDIIFLKLPLINDVVRSIVTTRFLRTISIMLRRGIPLVEILTTIEKTVGNSIASDAIHKCKDGILKGETLSSNLTAVKFFDPIVVELIGIGEETGQLDNILNTLCETSEKETDQRIESMVAAIEPLFTIIIGVTIAVLVLAMLLPMFNMISGFKVE